MEDARAPPESWEAAELDDAMTRLMLNDLTKDSTKQQQQQQQQLMKKKPSRDGDGEEDDDGYGYDELGTAPSSSFANSALGRTGSGITLSEDVINQVDQFLRDALQNPRERVSVLRMEQDIEKFIRDPTQQQFEFQQFPTSYLRLAAHRVAQHYSLQSMVLLDNSSPDGSGSRIIVRKTSDSQRPLIRLADIPVNPPSEESGVIKVAIKQRPQKHSHTVKNPNPNSLKANNSKSVEERKEEYNRARARIFNSGGASGSSGASYGSAAPGRLESDSRPHDGSLHGQLAMPKTEELVSDTNTGRGLIESSTSSSRSARVRMDKEPVGRYRPNNRVAIFRDREIDRKDPDYDRSYDRYMQRFDPGFGFNGVPYAMQPMYAPALNYNTEFPQLGPSHRPQVSTDHQPHPLPHHLPGQWSAPSNPAGINYGPPETLMPPFNPSQVGARPTSALYLHSTQFPCQHPGLPFMHPHEHVQHFPQSQQQPDKSFGLARPR